MEKTIILTYQDGSVCAVMHVANMDDKFMTDLETADHEWNAAKDGMLQDYESFVLGYVMGRGYKARLEEDYGVYKTSL